MPNDFKKFSELFLQCLEKNDSDFWGWDTWVLMEKDEDSGAIAYDPNQNLKGFYITHSLIILNKISDLENVSKYLIKLDKNSKYHFSESGDLKGLLLQMKTSPIADKKIEFLEKIFDESISIQENIEKEELRKYVVSKRHIEEFTDGIIKDYRRHSNINNIFKKYDLIEYKTKEITNKEIENFEIVTNITKSYFIEHDIHDSRTFGFGRNLAISESKEIMKEINSKSLDLNKEEFEKILKSNINDNYFILTTRRIAWSYFQTEPFKIDAKFKRCESDSNTLEDGYLITNKNKIPVFFISEGEGNSLLLANKTKFGKLIKLRPKPILDFNFVEVLDEGLSINIIDYTNNKAFKEKVLTNSNEFLKSKGAKIEQDDYLKEMVYVNVSERFILDLSNEFEVYSLKNASAIINE